MKPTPLIIFHILVTVFCFSRVIEYYKSKMILPMILWSASTVFSTLTALLYISIANS